MERCEWCLADAGRTSATRDCCRARRLDKMSMSMRLAAYQQEHLRGGKESADALHRLVLEYQAERLATAPKEARIKAYRHEEIEGSVDSALVLKQLTIEAYQRANAC